MIRSLVIVFSISLLANAANAEVSFTPLGLFDATGVSGDGSVVVGNWRGQLNFEPYRWTRSEGAVPLLPPGYSHGLPWEDQSRANAVSVDGSTVVGTQNFPGPYYYGWRWRADTGMTPITPYASSYFAEAVSGDGKVVVGPKRDGNFSGWRWTTADGLTDIPDQRFNAVSGDGSVFAGGRVLWSQQTGTVDLGDLPGGRDGTSATAISADGTTVVGTSSSSDGVLEGEAFRWTAASGIVGLGDFPGGHSDSTAQGVSGDGSIVVGAGNGENYVQAAFLWTNELGMVDLRAYLVSQGVDNLGGWTLGGATAISADGSTIVGWGTNPQGVTEGWVATIPEPSSLLLIGVAGLGLMTAVIRHRDRTARRILRLRVCFLLLVAIIVRSSASSASAAATFTPLGDLPGGSFLSQAIAVSDDGLVVVGGGSSGSPEFAPEAFRWTAEGGMVGLGDLPGSNFRSEAFGVSADGSVVVGESSSINGLEAFRWTAADGMIGLGDLPGLHFISWAQGVSDDGSVVVGGGISVNGIEAYRWTKESGMIGMGDLTGRNIASTARAVSGDGSVIVGLATSEAGITGGEAFRWTADSGMVGLGDLPGGSFISVAYDTSDDGAVVVGEGTTINGSQAFRWTAASGMVGLGDSAISAYGVSADGSVIVGQGSATVGGQAFYWTEALGAISLRDLLIANGATNLTGWNLIARDVSGDGLTIVGYGRNPAGDTEAWVATIPEPSSLLLIGVAGLGLMTAVIRHRGWTARQFLQKSSFCS